MYRVFTMEALAARTMARRNPDKEQPDPLGATLAAALIPYNIKCPAISPTLRTNVNMS